MIDEIEDVEEYEYPQQLGFAEVAKSLSLIASMDVVVKVFQESAVVEELRPSKKNPIFEWLYHQYLRITHRKVMNMDKLPATTCIEAKRFQTQTQLLGDLHYLRADREILDMVRDIDIHFDREV